jgi:hypothetical protein
VRARRQLARPGAHLLGRGEVHDQQVIGRTLLQLEDAAHRARIRRVGGEPVHGFGRQADHLAAAQGGDGAIDRGGRGREHGAMVAAVSRGRSVARRGLTAGNRWS